MSNLYRSKTRKRKKQKANTSQTIEKEIISNSGEKRKVVIKSSNTKDLSVSKLPKGQISYPALKVVAGQVEEQLLYDLRYPQAFYTYSEMLTNTTIASALAKKKKLLWKSLKDYRITTGKKRNKKAKDAQEYVEWAFNNMNQSWYDVCNNLLSYNKWGFSVLEKVYTKVRAGKYEGKLKVDKLSPISPKSIDEWVFTDNFHNMLGLIQSTEYQNNGSTYGKLRITTNSNRRDVDAEIEIPRNKVMLWSYQSEIGNPVGESPLAAAYKPWRSLEIVEDYRLVGISKNLGGVIHIELPQEIFAGAAADPQGADAAYINRMAEDAANIHAGDQAYFMTASDTFNGTTNKMYNVSLKGVEGGSVNNDLSSVTAEFKSDILRCFGLDPNDENNNEQSSTHTLTLESDLGFIVEQFNDDLIPQLLALNGFSLEDDEMPKFVSGEIVAENPEEFSKTIQRLGATGFISKHPKVIRNIMKRAGVPPEIVDELSDEDLMEHLPEDKSRVGDGMKEGLNSGVGSKDGSEGNSSDMNNENKA